MPSKARHHPKNNKMHVAVIGAGFCGLATAWNLAKQSINVTIFDSKGIGQGASGVAAGLLHPYVGAHAKRNWRASEGLTATLELLQVAEQALGEKIFSPSGILRPASTQKQIQDYTFCASKYSDVKWQSAEECLSLVPGLIPSPGLFIESGGIVNCPLYLKGLWLACQSTGCVKFEQTEIRQLSQLNNYDCIVITAGSATNNIKDLQSLPIQLIKGQVLEFNWPLGLAPLPCAINSQAYLLMKPSSNTCIAGSTYERQFENAEPNLQIAIQDILPKLHAFFPHIQPSSLIDCRAALRAIPTNRRPLLKRISEKAWVLTGMGSKGLLYHALYARALVNELLEIK